MPQSTLSLARTIEGLRRPPSPHELTELLFRFSKAEASGIDGDELTIEVTPDRLDLLSEGGLRQHLEGLLGERSGLPAIPRHDPGPEQRIRVAPEVSPVRPAIAAVLATAPPGGSLDVGLLGELVRFQEILHATLGLDRRSASLGIYPWERLHPPIRYAVRPLREIRFTPLGGTAPVDGPAFFAGHPMAARYGHLGRVGEGALVLEDRSGELLSLPPILNSATGGEARVGDRVLLLESTGRRSARVEDAVGLLELPLVARGWSLSPVHVEHPERAETGECFVRPRTERLPASALAAVAGDPWESTDAIRELGRARLGADPAESGWSVDVPPWRPDLQGPADLAEEVLLTRGLEIGSARLPASRRRGRRLPAQAFRRGLRERLLGLGFVPLFNPVLVAGSIGTLLGREPVALANPVSLELSHLRDALLLSLVQSLGRNVRFGYPQRLSEVGPVVLRAPGSETGARTVYHAGFLIAGEGVGFSDAAATLEYLLRRWQLVGVREPVELASTIPGRAARVRLAGEPIAEMGELHPSVLDHLGVPVPAVYGELDLDALAPLLGGS